MLLLLKSIQIASGSIQMKTGNLQLHLYYLGGARKADIVCVQGIQCNTFTRYKASWKILYLYFVDHEIVPMKYEIFECSQSNSSMYILTRIL